jgi:predicted heme/steroid binding protein/uncharacterized membrane protein
MRQLTDGGDPSSGKDVMNTFDPESLSQFSGKDGRPAYIAYKGRIIDVSASKFWKTGLHMNRHPAGRDLTTDIEAAPHGPEVLERYPQVGTLTTNDGTERSLSKPLERLLDRFPILRRHPHPMLVHFPIVFAISPVLFYLLYRITAADAFEATAFHCLGAGLLFCVPAILTGFFTWWLNYQAKPLRPVLIKILFSGLLVTFFLAAFLCRALFPADVLSLTGWGIIYLVLILALIPIVAVIGWYGASLTFPLERK